jgi:hypothetical protein
MLKLLFTFILLNTFLNAGVWTTIGGLGQKELKPDSTYTLDTLGQNPRVYEFTPLQNQDYTCIIVYTEGDYQSPTMQCIPKGKGRKIEQ